MINKKMKNLIAALSMIVIGGVFYTHFYNDPVNTLNRICIKDKKWCKCASQGLANILTPYELEKFSQLYPEEMKGFMFGLPLDKQMRIEYMFKMCDEHH